MSQVILCDYKENSAVQFVSSTSSQLAMQLVTSFVTSESYCIFCIFDEEIHVFVFSHLMPVLSNEIYKGKPAFGNLWD